MINPQQEINVSLNDRDLKKSLQFMISIVTFLEEMTRDMIRHPAMGVNFSIYQERVLKYQPTFDGMIEDFNDEVFGEYTNRLSKDEFASNLANQAWKYFNFKNLKDLFSIALQKYGMLENVEVDLPQFEKEDDEQDSEIETSFNFGNARRVIKDEVMAPAYVTPSLSEASQNNEEPIR